MKKRKIIILLFLVMGLFVFFSVRYVSYLRKAHSTFENYYAFRGCVQLLDKTSDYGICKTGSGQTVKIVKYQGRWYLEGDLPVCDFGLCF